jgi:ribosome-binding factor A
MNKRRVARMNEQLRREIAEIVQHHVRDPRVSAVSITVTNAQVTPDLQQARIFVSVAGDGDEKAAVIEGLSTATPFIRTSLAGRMELRRVPELTFQLDESLEYAMHIERLLHEVLPHGQPAVPATESGTDTATELDGEPDAEDLGEQDDVEEEAAVEPPAEDRDRDTQ